MVFSASDVRTVLLGALVFLGCSSPSQPPPQEQTARALVVEGVLGNPTEAGGQVQVGVRLSRAPAGRVVVKLTSSDETEGRVTPGELTFTATNWNAPQQALVTGVDDALADGPVPYALVLSVGASEDAAYGALASVSVPLTTTDDETAGATLGPVTQATTEAGGKATFTVALNAQPAKDVTVAVVSGNTAEGTLSPASLTFTAANWKAPQTVTATGVDDAVADGAQAYVARLRFASADAAFAALAPLEVALSNTDDDSAGFTLGAVGGATSEAGAQASVQLVLNSQPRADVTVHFDSTDATEGTLTQRSLTFTAQNWSAPQAITVTGVDDDVADGAQPYALAFGATTSQDAAYAALKPASVALSNTDDDSAGFSVGAASGPTTEAGGQATVSVVLNSEPTADVTLHFASSDTGEGTLTQERLTFTPANWRAPQSITVTGVDDDVADGAQPYALAFSATQSEDAAYAALQPANVALSNTDNDSAGITVSEASGNTDEDGKTATFTVALDSEPTADVTVSFESDNTGEGTVSPKSLRFTAADWSTAQTVTITGVPDGLDDGDQGFRIVFSATRSDDAAYAAITPGPVSVTNVDVDPTRPVSSAGVLSGSPWTQCRADEATAWLSSTAGGEYDPRIACQSIGYSDVDRWGGTCGTVCGYCGTKDEYYDFISSPPASISYEVHWRCVR